MLGPNVSFDEWRSEAHAEADQMRIDFSLAREEDLIAAHASGISPKVWALRARSSLKQLAKAQRLAQLQVQLRVMKKHWPIGILCLAAIIISGFVIVSKMRERAQIVELMMLVAGLENERNALKWRGISDATARGLTPYKPNVAHIVDWSREGNSAIIILDLEPGEDYPFAGTPTRKIVTIRKFDGGWRIESVR